MSLPHCSDNHMKTVCLSDLPKVTEPVKGRARIQTQVFVDSKAHPCTQVIATSYAISSWFVLRVIGDRITRAPFFRFF